LLLAELSQQLALSLTNYKHQSVHYYPFYTV
jgi:hypothetical protein